SYLGEFFAARNQPADALSNFREALALADEQSTKDTMNYALRRFYVTALVRVAGLLSSTDSTASEADHLFDKAISVGDECRRLAPSDVNTVAYLARAYRGKAGFAARAGDQAETSRALLKSGELWRE